jgi:Bacterial SH3 domain
VAFMPRSLPRDSLRVLLYYANIIRCGTGGTGVDVLESPSAAASTAHLKCGEKITILTERAVPYGWYRIRTQDGKEGYVRTVIGRPASICCQWRAEKPKEIISSWLYPFFLRRPRILQPKARKNSS